MIRISPAWVLMVALAACGGERAAQAAPPREVFTPLDGHVAWGRTLALEENDGVVNVLIRATPDPRGGFLVADEQENQVRRYDANGKLLLTFGRRGPGPREFTGLNRAFRLASGDLLAIDAFSHGAVFDSSGVELKRTFRVPVGQLKMAYLLNDSLLLLGAQLQEERTGDPDAHLHLWNLRASRLTGSFFPVHPTTPAHQFAVNTAGLVGAAQRGDTLAAVFALSDTLYLFDLSGRRLGTVPLRAEGLRRFDPAMRMPRMDLVSAREWFGRFSLVSDMWWLRDGSFLVQYQDREGVEPKWRLVHLARDGRRLFESKDTPCLVAVDPATDTLWFVRPGSPTPNAWASARLR
ncbi:MAG: hypothetical protein ACJ8GN_26520 [Longimicrobiaceae bacterium]